MPFTAAKCTQCNANLQVDSAKDAAICEHCGTPFVVEKAITNYAIHNTIHADTVVVAQSDFDIRAGMLLKYNGSATSVVIPDGVKAIGQNVFSGFKFMEQVTIPDSVEEIAENAFDGTTALRTVNMPDVLWKKYYRLFPNTEQNKSYLLLEQELKRRALRREFQLCQYCGGDFARKDSMCKKCGKQKDY